MLGEEIRNRLHDGSCVYGTHVTHTSNARTALRLMAAGLDFVFLCGEHMPLDRTETAGLCSLYASNGISPIYRIPFPSAAEALQALDAGAQGIVAPYVETVEQVRELVGAVRYRPIKGQVLTDLLSRNRKPTRKTVEFLQRYNRHTYLIIGIESVPAIERLDELIAVNGVDGVFIGPHDVSVSMEAPEEFANPKFLRVLEQIVLRCRAANIGVGAHLGPGYFPFSLMRRFVKAGMNWILDGSDATHAVASMKERREALGIHPETASGSAPNPHAATSATTAGRRRR